MVDDYKKIEKFLIDNGYIRDMENEKYLHFSKHISTLKKEFKVVDVEKFILKGSKNFVILNKTKNENKYFTNNTPDQRKSLELELKINISVKKKGIRIEIYKQYEYSSKKIILGVPKSIEELSIMLDKIEKKEKINLKKMFIRKTKTIENYNNRTTFKKELDKYYKIVSEVKEDIKNYKKNKKHIERDRLKEFDGRKYKLYRKSRTKQNAKTAGTKWKEIKSTRKNPSYKIVEENGKFCVYIALDEELFLYY